MRTQANRAQTDTVTRARNATRRGEETLTERRALGSAIDVRTQAREASSTRLSVRFLAVAGGLVGRPLSRHFFLSGCCVWIGGLVSSRRRRGSWPWRSGSELGGRRLDSSLLCSSSCSQVTLATCCVFLYLRFLHHPHRPSPVCVLSPTKSKVLPEGSKYLRIGPGFALQTVLSRSLNMCTKIGKRLDTCYKHGADELSLFFFSWHI